MKILFVTSTLRSGGTERVISLLANELSERGNETSIICLNKQIVFYPLNKDVNVYFAEKEVNSLSLSKKIQWLRKFVKAKKPDVVLPFMVGVYCTTLMTLIGVKVPIVCSERIDPRQSPFFRNILRKFILPLSTHLVVQTQYIKDFYPNFIKKKTTVIYNPVTNAVFELTDEPRSNTIVSVGRLYLQKNQKMLINAFDKIAKEYNDYKLIIYGEGPLRGELEKQIKDLKLEGKVLLPGVSDHVINELNKAKLFCLTSDYEGMSNALIEAICVGLPIISTKVSGVEELIEYRKNGRTVEIGDTEGLVREMSDLLGKEEELKAYGEENKRRAETFRIESILEQWEELLQQVIKDYHG